MTLIDKLITLKESLNAIDKLLVNAENPEDVKAYSYLRERVNSVFLALSQEWDGMGKQK